MVLFHSPNLGNLGVRHGFGTRLGGVSAAPFASLNCGGRSSVGGTDSADLTRENRRRLLHACGMTGCEIVSPHQVHGAQVAICRGRWPEPPPQADAVITRDRDRALLVTVADCAPILVACPVTGGVAAIHAGWRGLVADAIGATIRQMQQMFGSSPSFLLAAIGPAIGLEAFEVGEEVATAFDEAGLADAVVRRPEWPRPHVDLFAAAARRLECAGVTGERLDGAPLCTASHAELFFSHRRDHGVTGRLAAVIATPAPGGGLGQSS